MSAFNKIEEVLKLIAETGDRCIILSEQHDPYIIMDIAGYRRLLRAAAAKENLGTLTESELLEKINQNIAEWREARAEEISEYSLDQFQVDPQRIIPASQGGKRSEMLGKTVPTASQRVSVPRSIGMDEALGVPRPKVNLPIVEDESDEEYHLEPLS